MNIDPSRHLELARESAPPKEDEFIAKLTTLLMDKVIRDHPTGITRRDAHAKHHGCVHADRSGTGRRALDGLAGLAA